MLAFVARRILVAVPILFGISVVTYGLINAAPGSAVAMLANPELSNANRQALEASLGLNQPIWVRYFDWLGQVVQGNFGYSYVDSQPVLHEILSRLPATLELMGAALVIAYGIGIPLGAFVAAKQYSRLDYLMTVGAFLGVSIPTFFFGLLLIFVFSLELNWLPASGQVTLGGSGSAWDYISHLIMPATVLSLTFLAGNLRYVRGSLLDVLQQDYVRTARAKGLPERVVLMRHALRNALLPIITLAGLQVPALFAGAVIIEQVFGWPGMGRLAIQAIGDRDYPVIMGITLISAVLVVVGNLLADLAYAFVDPRVRLR